MADDSYGGESPLPDRGREDDDDDFGEGSFDGGYGSGNVPGGSNSQSVSNMPYDEAMTLSEDDSMDSLASPNRPGGAPAPAPAPAPAAPAPYGADTGLDSPPAAGNSGYSDGPDDNLGGYSDGPDDNLGAGAADASAVYPSAAAANQSMLEQPPPQQQEQPAAAPPVPQQQEGGGADSSDSDDDGATMGTGAVGAPSSYDPSRYADLRVGNDVKDLFQYIERYKPHQIELDTRLKPFIPEYIPAVGDIDAFLKVPRPDGAVESSHLQLGLGILDEPAAQQSDPTVLDLQLRQSRKAGNMKEASVRSLEAADKNPKQIEQWITSINELHRSKPQPTVTYSNDMPPVDPLMQAWPAKFEEMLRQIQLPTAEIDMALPEFVATICGVLDIPVYPGKLTQSLHALFSLFAEFKANQHFAMYAQQPGADGTGNGGFGEGQGGGFGATGEIAGTDTTFTGGGGEMAGI